MGAIDLHRVSLCVFSFYQYTYFLFCNYYILSSFPECISLKDGWGQKEPIFSMIPSEFCLLVSCQLLPAISRDLLLCCDFVFKSMNFSPRPDHSPSDHHLPHHLHHHDAQADTVNPFDTDVSLRPGNLYANLVLAESEQVFYHDYRLADNHESWLLLPRFHHNQSTVAAGFCRGSNWEVICSSRRGFKPRHHRGFHRSGKTYHAHCSESHQHQYHHLC